MWNLAYDAVLRTSLAPGGSVVLYAVDTLVLTTGDDFQEVLELAESGVAWVVYFMVSLKLGYSIRFTQ